MFGKAMPSIIISGKSITTHRFEALPVTIQKKRKPNSKRTSGSNIEFINSSIPPTYPSEP